MDDLTSGRKRARIPDLPEIARALGVAPETLGAHLLAVQQGEPEPKPAPERGRQKALAAQFEVSQSLVRTAISRRGPRQLRAPEDGDEAASAAAETAPEAAPGAR